MGSLAWVHSQSSRLNSAKTLLFEGEPLVEVYPEEHGKFLCIQAKILFIDGQQEIAYSDLQRASQIASDIKAGRDSELMRAIVEASDYVDLKNC